MVAPTNFNLQTLRGKAFQGFVQFQIPTDVVPPSGVGTWYRLKERQTMQFSMQFPRATHYSDDGGRVTAYNDGSSGTEVVPVPYTLQYTRTTKRVGAGYCSVK